jgi:hypothetical protein
MYIKVHIVQGRHRGLYGIANGDFTIEGRVGLDSFAPLFGGLDDGHVRRECSLRTCVLLELYLICRSRPVRDLSRIVVG